MAAKDYPQLHKAVIPELNEWLKILGLRRGREYTFNAWPFPKYNINGSIIDCASAEAYQSAFRGPNYSGGFGDEVDFWKKEAWLAFKGRIRKKPEIIRTGSSPFGFNHVHRDYYVNKEKFRKLIRMTTYDNPFISPEYIKSLESAYTAKLIEQELKAKRISMTGEPVYCEFNPNVHVTDLSGMTKMFKQIYFCVDYNIAKYCGIFVIYHEGVLYVVGELVSRYKGTEWMAEKAKSLFLDKERFVLGDSTGNDSKDVKTEQTNYKIFREKGWLPIKFRNPSVRARTISVNCNFGNCKIIIDKSCVELIQDLELVQYKDETSELDKSNPERTHATDSLGYADWYFQGVGKLIVKASKQYRPR